MARRKAPAIPDELLDQLDTRINPVKVVEFVIMGWPAPLAAIG